MKNIKKIRRIAKEEPLWLCIVLIAANVILTAINITMIVAKLKGWY